MTSVTHLLVLGGWHEKWLSDFIFMFHLIQLLLLCIKAFYMINDKSEPVIPYLQLGAPKIEPSAENHSLLQFFSLYKS
jgi:hypothetical protein